MDQQEEITVIETGPSRLKKIITSRPAAYLGAAVAGALSVVVLSALNSRRTLESPTFVLEAEQEQEPTTEI